MGCTPRRHARLLAFIKRERSSSSGLRFHELPKLVRAVLTCLAGCCHRGPLAILTLGCVLLLTIPVFAQRVVLVPPAADDATLSDAFNRLRAELNIHDFEVEVRDIPLGHEPTDALTRVAQTTDAFAAIALLRRRDQATVQIWLVDRVSGKATMRALQVEPGSDAANLLSIRAVDLLRASLREFNLNEKPPADVANVDRRAVPRVVRKLAQRPAPVFSLRADVMAVYQWPQIGASAGPALGGAFRLGDAVELNVVAAGPLIGAKYASPEGTTALRQEFAWVEPCWHALRFGRASLGVGVVAGGLLLHASGQPKPPLVAQSAVLFGFLWGFGLHSEVELSHGIAAEFALRALGTAPRMGLRMNQEQMVIGMPMPAVSLGLRVAL